MSRLGKRIVVIPDTQVRPGVPTHHLDWVGAAIRDYKPDVVVHLGDHWDMESLSSHAGALESEGRRYIADIDSGNAALQRLDDAMGPVPRKVILRGNHEQRIERVVKDVPKLAGALTYDHFNDRALGWEVVEHSGSDPGIINICGIKFAHYFTPANTNRAIGGDASYKLSKIGESFVQGHVQGLSIGDKQFATGKCIRGVVAGSCYLHDESYKGHANAHWRGIVVLNEVYPDGRFSVMDVTLTKLCQKYAGESLRRFLQRNTRAGRDGLLSLSRAA